MDIDLEELKEQWGLGNFGDRDGLRASGQAFYLMAFKEDIRTMLKPPEGE